MDRKTGRALAKSTLTALDVFDQVEGSEPDIFTGPLIAVAHSKSLSMLQDARGDFDGPAEIFITIFVRRAANSGDAAEDMLDDLVRAAMRALWGVFYPLSGNLQIVSVAGTPVSPKGIDGKNYRMERFAVRFNDDED